MTRFFSENIHENTIELDAEESRHLAKVLRYKEGDKVEVFDGKGNLFLCSIIQLNPKKALLSIEQKTYKEEKFYLTLAVAPTKNLSRWEWLMEKATELGVDRIIPFVGNNSERKVLKLERQQKILISAAKQSLKQHVPQLSELTNLKDLLTLPFEGDKFIAHCYENDLEKMHLQKACSPKRESLILIGPEGDFSESEVENALKSGFKQVSLGNSRLRTETAALAACHIINLANE